MTGFIAYWVYALITVGVITGFNRVILQNMFITSKKDRITTVINGAAFLPVIGVFFVSFVPNAAQLTPDAILLLILMAGINGAIEELYWRGMYIYEFNNNWRGNLIISPLLFGAYHISLWFIKGMTYQGGFFALVGGAFVMGLLWAGVAWKTGNIRACTFAHILVNLFAFTGLFVENGFQIIRGFLICLLSY